MQPDELDADVQAELAGLRERWQAQQAPPAVIQGAQRAWRMRADGQHASVRTGLSAWWGGAALAGVGSLLVAVLWLPSPSSSPPSSPSEVTSAPASMADGGRVTPRNVGAMGPRREMQPRPAMPAMRYPTGAAARVSSVAGWSVRVPNRPDAVSMTVTQEQVL